MYNNWYTHYSRKSVFVQKKNYQRSHNVCFQNQQGAFHWTSLYPGELPRIPVRILTHTHKIWREKKKKDIYTDSRGSNIFLKVTLWSSKIWTVIFFFSFVASCLISEQWAWWGSVCAGLGGRKWWSQRGTQELWPQWVRAQVQGAPVRGTRVSETRLILEWPTMKMVRGVAV